KPFLMPIEDVFTISGRGTVVTGVEMFRKVLDEGQAGDNIGVLLRGTKKEEVERGMVVAKPKTITPHTKYKAEVYVMTKNGGGRGVGGVGMVGRVGEGGGGGEKRGGGGGGRKREGVGGGMVLAKPKTITPHTKFKAEVYVLTKEEGGRHTPFFNGYRPQFYF